MWHHRLLKPLADLAAWMHKTKAIILIVCGALLSLAMVIREVGFSISTIHFSGSF